MISVTEADKIIQEALAPFPIIEKPLSESLGLILREDIYADRDFPPFNKSLMDGIAINYGAWEMGVRQFAVEGMQSAGTKALRISAQNGCTEIMTGAVLTKGCDCVIPVEYVELANGTATVTKNIKLSPNANLRLKGTEHRKRAKLLKKGHPLLPPQVAVAASVGKACVKVSARPKIAVISTGDEIVDIDAEIEPYQIRKSNEYFMQAALDQTRLFTTFSFHFVDNEKVMRKHIGAILENYDVLVLTGGVSMGRKDFVPRVLEDLGVKALFHNVAQRPGRPFWFGTSKDRKAIFALPGNPVSTQVGIYRYVIPHLRSALGCETRQYYAVLSKNFVFKPKLAYFLPVRVKTNKKGFLEAVPVEPAGSGDMATVGKTDGFVELPAQKDTFPSGYTASYYAW